MNTIDSYLKSNVYVAKVVTPEFNTAHCRHVKSIILGHVSYIQYGLIVCHLNDRHNNGT